MLGATVHVFGDVAIAFGVCKNIEYGEKEGRGVGAYLLVREAEGWRIAAQAWDTENGSKKIPDYLLE